MNNPYSPSSSETSQVFTPETNVSQPTVVYWFKVYLVVLIVLYALCTVGGLLFMFIPIDDPETPPWFGMLMGGLFFLMGLALTIACTIPFFVARRPWLWVYNLVLICFGLTSACFLPFCIPMLIFWLKPEVKLYYGKPA